MSSVPPGASVTVPAGVEANESIVTAYPWSSDVGSFGAAAARAAELLCALAALILSAPLCALIALIIRLDSPGPAIFRQARLGRGRQMFRFYKFRTLYVDAKERFPELYVYKYSSDEIERFKFKMENDPRLTRVGRWLRKTTLDELPNFVNVLTGEMSLVGPRPEIPEMLRYYRPEELIKFSVRPGVTGLAQTSGRGHLTFRDTVRYDVDYVRTRSFRLDMKLIGLTILRTIKRDGAF